MPIQITISGDTAIEALKELHGLSAGLSAPQPDTRPVAEARLAAQVAEEVPADETKAFPEAPKQTRKRAAKAEPAPVADQAAVDDITGASLSGGVDPENPPEAEEPAEERGEMQAETQEKPFTVDDARTALSDLLKQPDGKTKAQAVFAEMGCTKLSEIPEGSYKAFIAAIAKARGL